MTEEMFSNRLKKLRRKCGMTQSDVAKALHVSRSCVANYEKGNRQPDLGGMRNIAEYFQVSLDYLSGHSFRETGEIPLPEQQPKSQSQAIDIKLLMPEDKLAMLRFYRYILQSSV